MQKIINEGIVVHLKEQIELENEAGKRVLHGPSDGTGHAVITYSMDRMWDNIEQLEKIAGKEVMKRFLMRL